MSRRAASREQLRDTLEDLYERYNKRVFVSPDPLMFLYDYGDRADREIVGLAASTLAFGSVKQIGRSIEAVLAVMGSSPAGYLEGSSAQDILDTFKGFKHRWVTGGDLSCVLIGAKNAIEKYGSLEACLREGFDEAQRDVVPALELFVDTLTRDAVFSCTGIFPSPCRASACKRLNLYLRWMVRSDAVDPGGWNGIPAAKLVVPLDTHMHRFGLALGLTGRRQPDLKTAREITDAFREIAPHDPVKYDFALTRLGIRRDSDRPELLMRLGIREALQA